MKQLWILCVVCMTSSLAQADLYFEEELVNPGFGKNKTGARTTRHAVYIKGKMQKVDSRILVDRKMERTLKSQGHPLRSGTLLNLAKAEVFEMNFDDQTVVRSRIPARDRGAAKKASKQRKAAQPKIAFAFKTTGDSSTVAGIACKRVIAQMRALYNAGTKSQRENRYTYDACIADAFAGWSELSAFQTLQDTSTSYPNVIGDGLDPLRNQAQDINRLENEIQDMNAELDGFALRSTLTASVRQARNGKWSEVFRLERRVKSLRHAPLPDSIFTVPKTLTRVKKK